MQRSFDIIIAGGGMAGLSLLWFLKRDGYNGSVCLIDSFESERKDRTWSYWSKDPGPFDHLSHTQWTQARVVSGKGKELLLDLYPYRYLSISGSSFHNWMLSELENWDSLTRVKATIETCSSGQSEAWVSTDQGTFHAGLVFDSIFKPNFRQPKSRSLLQHFLGYEIETQEDCFDPSCPDLMNFQVKEQTDCHFIYILPQTRRRALVEYTVFSEDLLPEMEYDLRLREWLRNKGIQHFEIKEVEKGVIPMSDARIAARVSQHLYRIGTSGGFTNPATGYTFYTTTKILEKWSKDIVSGREIQVQGPIWKGKFLWYYATLLEVLKYRMQAAHEVFFNLYQKNPAPRILSFLNGESDFRSEWAIMYSTRIWVFIRAGLKVSLDLLIRKLFYRN